MATTKHPRLATIAVALVAFVFGCVTEALVVPPVRAGTNPTRWEYKCLDTRNPEAEANQLGSQGWEMAAVFNAAWCFKRPLP